MSKIAIDARIINSSTGTYIQNLIKELEIIDKINEYIIIVPTADKDFYKPKNSHFKVVTADFPLYSFSEQLGFGLFLDKLNVDLVHFCLPQQPLLYRGKRVTTFHDLTLLHTYNTDKNELIYKIKQSIGRFAFKRIAQISDAIITPTKYVQKEVIDTFNVDSKKVHQFYEAASIINDNELIEYNLPFKKYILYVGKQSDYKNIKRLGDAHQILLTKYPDLGLVLAGKINSSVKINQKYFLDKNYSNIIFTGIVSNEQRDWLYKHAQAYVFPSLMEGFGLPGLEAMGYGAPVVSSNATCLPEVYGGAAEYFNPLNVDEIAEAIEKVIDDPQLKRSLIEKGHTQFKKYSWKRMARQTHAVYLEVLER